MTTSAISSRVISIGLTVSDATLTVFGSAVGTSVNDHRDIDADPSGRRPQ